MVDPKIGIAIPCHNNLDVIVESLPSIYDDNYFIVVFDDGSTDGTEEWIHKNFPEVHCLRGNGQNWWTGSIAKAIDLCLKNNCEYVVSLNADVIINPSIVSKLLETSKKNNDSIVASLVVDLNNKDNILWSGSFFQKIHKFIPIYTSKYFVKSGTKVKDISSKEYEVDEVHGRGVLLPRQAIEKIGNYDFKNFPQYGGDTDFSFRAKKNGIAMLVEPSCIAKVFVDNTSLNKKQKLTLIKKIKSIKNYLFDRKNGEALYVWWNLYRKHLPLRYFIQSYIFVILLNLYRKITN
jgi:GT2 family glycosyltransferase